VRASFGSFGRLRIGFVFCGLGFVCAPPRQRRFGFFFVVWCFCWGFVFVNRISWGVVFFCQEKCGLNRDWQGGFFGWVEELVVYSMFCAVSFVFGLFLLALFGDVLLGVFCYFGVVGIKPICDFLV